eukprot:gnl/MRDRNA2_/MRDRNA2_98885_c0_seq1.p1 gnl/MRDRNA2_/MRDRNA2_98885_c0~~gnl/MRDRNA2_/MRDRNA2_98885_c0_seq1.p1  ORF type:complete len:749 (-),score=118.19 gnl/MRDRNA2_/MRDRNA2_98885_c0_seq1:91-2337(-)
MHGAPAPSSSAESDLRTESDGAKMSLGAKLKASFKKWDTADHGVISREQLKLLLRKCNPYFTDQELDFLFDFADTNHNGVVEYDEFVDFVYSISGEKNPEGDKKAEECKSEPTKGVDGNDQPESSQKSHSHLDPNHEPSQSSSRPSSAKGSRQSVMERSMGSHIPESKQGHWKHHKDPEQKREHAEQKHFELGAHQAPIPWAPWAAPDSDSQPALRKRSVSREHPEEHHERRASAKHQVSHADRPHTSHGHRPSSAHAVSPHTNQGHRPSSARHSHLKCDSEPSNASMKMKGSPNDRSASPSTSFRVAATSSPTTSPRATSPRGSINRTKSPRGSVRVSHQSKKNEPESKSEAQTNTRDCVKYMYDEDGHRWESHRQVAAKPKHKSEAQECVDPHQLAVFGKSTSAVASCCELPGGLVASGTEAGVIMFWDPATQEVIGRLKAFDQGVLSLVALPEQRLAANCVDGSVCIWSVLELSSSPKSQERKSQEDFFLTEKILSCPKLTVPVTKVCSMCLLSISQRLACGCEDGTISIIDLKKCEVIAVLGDEDRHYDRIEQLVDMDGARLGSCSLDGLIKVWDISTNAQTLRPEAKCLMTMAEHKGSVTSIATIDGGRELASIGDDGTVRVWETCHGTLQKTLIDEERLHDADGRVILHIPWAHRKEHPGHLVTGHTKGRIAMWDLKAWKVVKTLKGHSGDINGLTYLPNHKDNPNGAFASCAEDNTVRIWATQEADLAVAPTPAEAWFRKD